MDIQPFNYALENCGEYLLITASGTQRSNAEVTKFYSIINDACQKHGCSNVLLNETKLLVSLSMEDVLKIANFAAFHRNIKSIAKIACVPGDYSEANATLFQHIAVSKHINYRMFANKQAAIAWLTSA